MTIAVDLGRKATKTNKQNITATVVIVLNKCYIHGFVQNAAH